MQFNELRSGDELANYLIERELGRGGMATVFLAKDRKHHRPVAIKVMHPELANAVGSHRFLREIEIVAHLEHPHILPLFDSGESNGLLYYVMPCVEGETLRDRISREAQMSLGDTVQITKEVASALSYAHARGVIHRDVKPENIMLSGGKARVTDFGIAAAISQANESESSPQMSSTGIVMGTPAYMSPEQGSGDSRVDARTDIYALGCVVYEMLAGSPPFTGPNALAVLSQHMLDDPRPLRSRRPRLPIHVERAVARALAKIPADRFPAVSQFAAALEVEESRSDAEPPARARSGSGRAQITGPTTPIGVTAPNLGAFVSRMCNRWKQVNAFDACFRESQRKLPGRPQFYVVHGEEGEGHESLVDRLLTTRLSGFASEMAGEENGTVVSYKIPWPEGDDLITRRRDLNISLFREIAPNYLGDDLSPAALVSLSAQCLSPIAVVQHDIRAARWDRNTAQLMRWYVSFWNSYNPGDRTQLFLIFLKIIYPQQQPGGRLTSWLRSPKVERREIQETIRGILNEGNAGCSAVLFNELSPITVDDVKNWFNQNGVYESEQRRREVAEAIFRGSASKRYTEVEFELEQIHRDFVKEYATRHGEASW